MITQVDLTDEDAAKFLLFQKYYDIFSILDKKCVFEMQFGKVMINMAYGEIQNVVQEEVVYRK